jgi:hypothetical protein
MTRAMIAANPGARSRNKSQNKSDQIKGTNRTKVAIPTPSRMQIRHETTAVRGSVVMTPSFHLPVIFQKRILHIPSAEFLAAISDVTASFAII